MKFPYSNHRIGAHTCTNHTVPYGTALWGGVVPGTSCQATISLSLRDKSHLPIEDSHEVSVYASSPRGLAASRWSLRTEEQNTGETPTTIASASYLPKVVGRRGVLPSRKCPKLHGPSGHGHWRSSSKPLDNSLRFKKPARCGIEMS
jgi:hypothetical protein